MLSSSSIGVQILTTAGFLAQLRAREALARVLLAAPN
jgi:hypothetical protein